MMLPRYGLAYGEETQVRILLLRGKGRLLIGEYEVRDHPNPNFVIIQRKGGQEHCSDGSLCNCPGFRFRKRCKHIDSINEIGSVSAIKKALAWQAEIKEMEDG